MYSAYSYKRIYLESKNRYLSLKGGNKEIQKHVFNTIKTSSIDILKYMSRPDVRKEIFGHIAEKNEIGKFNIGDKVVSPPNNKKSLAAWHSHPPLSVLSGTEEDIFFTPPSSADIYYLIIASLLKLYHNSYIISYEGIYSISVENPDIYRGELQEILNLDDQFVMPAEPIVGDNGLIGFDWHGRDKEYQNISKLLSLVPNYHHDNLKSAVFDYKVSLAKLGITLDLFQKYLQFIMNCKCK